MPGCCHTLSPSPMISHVRWNFRISIDKHDRNLLTLLKMNDHVLSMNYWKTGEMESDTTVFCKKETIEWTISSLEKPIIKNRRIWRGSSLKSGEIESPCRGCRQLYQWPFGEIQRAGNPTNATHMWDLLSLYSKSPIFGWFPSLFKSNLPPNFPNFHFKSLFLSFRSFHRFAYTTNTKMDELAREQDVLTENMYVFSNAITL